MVKLLLGVDAVKAKAMLKDYKEELPILAKMILPDPDKLQNADDNNVTMKSALDFVEKAKRAGKQDFIRLHITDHGGRKIDVPSIEHGHSLPNNKQSFERMASDAQAVIQDKAFIEGFKSLIVDG